MPIDRYTKAVLTVIAVCLLWISLGGPSMLPTATAQVSAADQRVVIAGWVDDQGTPRPFPRPLVARPNSLSAGIPVATP